MQLTFEQLPEAIGRLEKSQARIEKIVTQLSEDLSNSKNSEKLLTVVEAAEFLTLSVPTIYTMVHKGQLPVNKKSKRLYFLKSELVEFIKTGQRQPLSQSEIEPEQYLKPQKRRS